MDLHSFPASRPIRNLEDSPSCNRLHHKAAEPVHARLSARDLMLHGTTSATPSGFLWLSSGRGGHPEWRVIFDLHSMRIRAAFLDASADDDALRRRAGRRVNLQLCASSITAHKSARQHGVDAPRTNPRINMKSASRRNPAGAIAEAAQARRLRFRKTTPGNADTAGRVIRGTGGRRQSGPASASRFPSGQVPSGQERERPPGASWRSRRVPCHFLSEAGRPWRRFRPYPPRDEQHAPRFRNAATLRPCCSGRRIAGDAY